jgi:hypothetical protein
MGEASIFLSNLALIATLKSAKAEPSTAAIFHLSGKWICRARLLVKRGDCQVSVPSLTHSEVVRVRDRPNIPKPWTVSDLNAAGLVDALIAIGHERQQIMEAMKAALLRGDDDAALEHAHELTALPSHKSPASVVRT